MWLEDKVHKNFGYLKYFLIIWSNCDLVIYVVTVTGLDFWVFFFFKLTQCFTEEFSWNSTLDVLDNYVILCDSESKNLTKPSGGFLLICNAQIIDSGVRWLYRCLASGFHLLFPGLYTQVLLK